MWSEIRDFLNNQADYEYLLRCLRDWIIPGGENSVEEAIIILWMGWNMFLSSYVFEQMGDVK